MEYLQWVAAAGVMVGVLVVIHELGHWAVARWFGVGTPEFAVGIGPRIASFRWLETEFRLNLLPIGGYVRMSGADPFGEENASDWVEPEKDFMRKPVWQRLLIMLAGPAMNLALPFVLFTSVMMLGDPQASNQIGTVYPTGRAEKLGIKIGDRIVAADGQPTDTWSDLTTALIAHAEDPVLASSALRLDVERDGKKFEVSMPPESLLVRPDGTLDRSELGFWPLWRSTLIGVPDPASPAAKAGLTTGDVILSIDGAQVSTWEDLQRALAAQSPHALVRARLESKDGGSPQVVRSELTLTPDPSYLPDPSLATDALLVSYGLEHPATYVGSVQPGSAAERAGVLVGDRILTIDGAPVIVWSDVLRLVAKTTDGKQAPRELALELLRDGKRTVLTFAPTYESEIIGGSINYRPIMGVTQYYELEVSGEQVRKYYSFPEAFSRSIQEIEMLFTQTMRLLGNLVGLNIWPTEAIGGPVAIIRVAGESAKQGLFSFAKVMAMISFSLGIVNLLPVPVLDGGQIVFYSIEWIRGRPLPLSWRERIQMIGVLGILALLVWVTVNDVRSWLGG